MLFNSHLFILFFLPITFGSFWWIKTRSGNLAARRWALCITFVFFAWWHPPDLLVLWGSLVGNYFIGRRLLNYPPGKARGTLVAGIVFNLTLLGYFKYTRLITATAHWMAGGDFVLGSVILPLGISFFTFQQIAYIVDCSRGEADRYVFFDYCLFVTFFPHLNAGPIIHHRELMEEFTSDRRCSSLLIAQGLTLFVIGLCKKVILADTVATYVAPVFGAAAAGHSPAFLDAWLGTLAYTGQLYFDFSGYSDMAIGVGLLFGVHLPVNFASPYKSLSISEFWRRWHITLSRFLRTYLYFPLGGSRQGRNRTSANLLITMLLGGLWHGANWTFVAWGGLHGLALAVNHRFTAAIEGTPFARLLDSTLGRLACWTATFLGVIAGWVLFRADSFGSAWRIWRGMVGLNGLVLQDRHAALLRHLGLPVSKFAEIGTPTFLNPNLPTLAAILGLLLLAFLAPNSQTITGLAVGKGVPQDALPRWAAWLRWRPSLLWAAATALCGLVGMLYMTQLSEFLYFQF